MVKVDGLPELTTAMAAVIDVMLYPIPDRAEILFTVGLVGAHLSPLFNFDVQLDK